MPQHYLNMMNDPFSTLARAAKPVLKAAKPVITGANAAVGRVVAPVVDAGNQAVHSALGLTPAKPSGVTDFYDQQLAAAGERIFGPARQVTSDAITSLREALVRQGATPGSPTAPNASVIPTAAAAGRSAAQPYLPTATREAANEAVSEAAGQPTGVPGVSRYLPAGSQTPTFSNIDPATGRPTPESVAAQSNGIESIVPPVVSSLERPRTQAPPVPSLSTSGGLFSALANFQSDAARYLGEVGSARSSRKNAAEARAARKTESDILTQEANAASQGAERASLVQERSQKIADNKRLADLRNEYLALDDQNDPAGTKRTELERKISTLAGKTKADFTTDHINAARAILADPLALPEDKEVATAYLKSVLSANSKAAPTQPRDAPTATNPKTGEKLILKDGKWQPLQENK